MKKRNIIPLLLIFCPYIFLLMIFLSDENNFDSLLVTYLLFTTVIYILNIINACKINEENDFYNLAFWNMIIKLMYVPFFVFIFFTGIMFFIIYIAPISISDSPLNICSLYTGYVFWGISFLYGINSILRMKRKNIISKGEAIVYIILHLIFILDLFTSIGIFVKSREEYKKR